MDNRLLLKDMRLFSMVARAASFAAVARKEGMSPAFVSKRIAVLEQALKIRLFHRTTRSVSLTQDGEATLRHVQKILADVDQMSDSMAHDQAVPSGLLRISSSAGFGRNQLAPALSELARLYPLLHLQLELLDRPVDLIGEGFDLDIRVGGSHEPSLIALHLARNYRVLCASPDYLAKHGTPQRLEDLAHHRCIVTRERDQSFGLWRLSGPNGIETIKVPTPLSSNNGEIVHQWGVEGHGIFLRAIWDVGADLRKGLLIRLLPDYSQDADVAAIYPHRLEQSNRLRACVRFLKSWFASHAPDGYG
ncbi:LysR substrate-binding domain-containing protein [Telmatospirillum sp.]|uniref:LysR substrate-binding domain-containing protein n=1 Tax=Telmatospirillum sp. TaxID=2079197 RepID=UPI002844A1C5|nr:LysR substrate-binding domain-containing protein [Telmatospirillum sp.]MDR3437087.1 LysR substrate-binding domain-containing protein [Telmatospirillum sp.]